MLRTTCGAIGAPPLIHQQPLSFLVGLLQLDVGLGQVGGARVHFLFQVANQRVHAIGHGVEAAGQLAEFVGAVDLGAHL